MPLRRALSLFAVAALTACGERGREPAPAVEREPPRATRGYVVVSIDTLRADRLGCYGYGAATSPFLDALAARATLFEEAYAQYPSTLVSHLSMFTGLHPREHGVLPPQAVLAATIETFPEVFQRAGFRTAGYTEGGYMSGRYGFRRGFDDFLARDKAGERHPERTFARGVRFLEGLAAEDRFLLFLHTYAVHAPYDAPERYQRMFWQGEPPPGAFPPGARALAEVEAEGRLLPPDVVRWLSARYDAGIRETDDLLRAFFDDLERLGLAADTTVLITADHGEEFFEHGRLQHSQLYREVLRVPLLVVHPDQRQAARRREVVELVDLAPTLYALARLRPAAAVSGASFAGMLGSSGTTAEGTAFADGPAAERALYRGAEAGVESLLVFDPPADDWASRELVFDAAAGELAFEARAWGEPRRLVVAAGEGAAAEVSLAADRWTPVRVQLPVAGRVRLAVDGCAMEGSPKRLYHCRGFQVRGIRPARVELYDLASDPAQRADLSRRRPDAMRALLRELLAFTPAARAAPVEGAPDPALEESLRALGYLQ